MQITRAEIIAVIGFTSISLTVPGQARFFEFAQSGRQPYARTDHNQRPAAVSDIAATVDCLTDITTINHSKAPRPLNLLQCHSVLTFARERSLSVRLLR